MNRDLLLDMQRLAGVHPRMLGESGPGPEFRQEQPLTEGAEATYKLTENQSYGVVSLLRRRLMIAYVTLTLLRKGLDSIVYSGEDVAKAAQALRDGAVSDAEELVKALGFALSSDFSTTDRYGSRDNDADDGMPSPYYSERGLGTLSLRLLGDVAAVKVTGREVMPRIKKDSNSFYSTDVEAAQKAWPPFNTKIDALADKIRDSLGDMAAAVAKAAVVG